MRQTKDEIAQDMYDGYDFVDLTGGEKAAVTKRFNAQTGARARSTAGTVIAEIGRSGNGVKKCALDRGATVADLVKQGKFTIDKKKEAVIAQSTGNGVDLDEEIVAGEVYIISPEIRSA